MKLFTKLFLTFAMLCFAGVFNAVAETEVTLLPTDFTAIENSEFAVSKGGVNISCTQGTVTADQIRVFKNQTITFSCANNIKKIVFTCTANGTTKFGPGGFNQQDGYTFEAEGPTGTWEGAATSVAFTAESNQVRLTQVVITTDAPEALFADGKYFIFNKGAQKYLGAGASWGTHAVVNADGLDYNIAFVDGKYTLDSQVSNGGNSHFLNGEWNDGAAMGWTFAPVEGAEGLFTISNGEKFLTALENGEVTLADDATVAAAQWTLKTLADRLAELATATVDAPVDASFLVIDGNFSRNDLRKSAWTMNASNQNLSGGNNTNNCAESYHSTFTLSQVISKAPAGKYKMTAQGFYRQDGETAEALPVFYANDKTAEFPAKTGDENNMGAASESFTAGKYTIDPIAVTVFEDGQLTVGAKGTAVSQWVIFDNFRLSYLTSEIPAEEFAPAYTTALAAAQAALADETYAAVTGEERTALAKAIEDYSTVDPSVEFYRAAISALNAATSAFTSAKAAYETFNLKSAGLANLAFPYAAAPKAAAAQAAVNVQPTSAADAAAKTEALLKAYRQYAESSAMLEGTYGPVNHTDSIAEINADQNIWTTGSIGTNQGQGYTDGDGVVCGKYLDGGWSSTAGVNIALTRKFFVPAGKYILTTTARGSNDLTEYTLSVGGQTVNLPHNGADANVGLFGNGWDDASVEFESTGDSLTIELIAKSEAFYNWISINRFRLYQFGVAQEDAPEVTVPDGMVNLITNGNLAGDDVTSYVAKEAPSADILPGRIVEMAGKDCSHGLVVKSADNPAQPWDTQFWISLNQELPVGAKLHVEFDYVANKAAKASTQTHGAPGSYKGGFKGDINFTTEWQKYSVDYEVTSAGIQSIALNLAEEKTATEYRFDNFGVWAEMPKEVTWKDIIVNGDMEGSDAQCFFVTEATVGPKMATFTEGIGKDGSKAIKLQSADSPAQDWDTQFFIRLPYQLPAGTRYKVSFDYKADKEGGFDTQAHGEPGGYIWWSMIGSGNFTTDWQTFSAEGAISTDQSTAEKPMQTIAFNLAKNKVATEFIFDNVKFEVDEEVLPTLNKNPYVGPDAPEIAVPDGMINLIANGNLANDSLVANYVAKEAPSADILPARIVAGAGKDYSHGIVVKSADDPAQAWDTQFWISLNEELPVGAKLHVEFDYAANKAAKVSTQTHAAPGSYKGGFKGDINFTTEWQKYSVDYDVTAAGIQSIALNLAEEKTATEYYFDNFGVWYEAPVPVEEWTDLIVNGNMEGESMECFYVTEQGVGGPFVAVATEGIGKDGSKAVKVQSADSPAQDWDSQFFIRLPYQLPAGTKYKVSFDYKADKEGGFDTQAHAEPGQYIHWAMIGSGNFTTDWQTYENEGVVPEQCDGSENKNDAGEVLYVKTFQTIAFNLAKNKVATMFVFDNVKFEIPADVAKTLTPNPAVNPQPYPVGIQTVKSVKNVEGMYNLNGQKVNKAQKGLYILNGKKMVVK